jgi:hypothetical protein
MAVQEALLELFQKLERSLGSSRRGTDDIALPVFDLQRTDSGALGGAAKLKIWEKSSGGTAVKR